MTVGHVTPPADRMSGRLPPALRRARQGVAALLGLVAGIVVGCSGEAWRPPPNVVLILVDTLRPDHLHGYGYPRATSPTLDRLMREGVRVDAAISNSSWSAPAHTTIITGTHEYHHRVLNFGQRIAPRVKPLAVPFQRAGYATGLFSTHYALYGRVGRITEGMDHRLILKNEEDAGALAAAAEWASRQEQPYFAYVVLMGPHAPYDKYPPSYDRDFFTDRPPGGEKVYPLTRAAWVGEGGIPQSVQLEGRQDLGYYINRYDRSIRFTDDLIGKFLGELEAAGRLENTLLVVTSDHGEGLGDHDSFAHELYLYDFLVRVPLIVWFPGVVPAGQEWSALVPTVDIAPTILGLSRLERPDWMDGRDLSGALRRGRQPEEATLVHGIYRLRGYERYMVRSARYKLILDAAERRLEFYDLRDDPEESRDLSGDRGPEFPAGAYRELEAAMGRLVERHSSLATDRSTAPLGPDVVEELRALGYVVDP